MMILKTALGVAASLGLMTSTAAIAQTATSSVQVAKARQLPVSNLRSTAKVRKVSSQSEGTGVAPIVIAVGAAAAVGLGIAVAVSEDDEPDSPN